MEKLPPAPALQIIGKMRNTLEGRVVVHGSRPDKAVGPGSGRQDIAPSRAKTGRRALVAG
jgi:hypothetical protein